MLNTLPPRHKPKIPPNDAKTLLLFSIVNSNRRVLNYEQFNIVPINESHVTIASLLYFILDIS